MQKFAKLLFFVGLLTLGMIRPSFAGTQVPKGGTLQLSVPGVAGVAINISDYSTYKNVGGSYVLYYPSTVSGAINLTSIGNSICGNKITMAGGGGNCYIEPISIPSGAVFNCPGSSGCSWMTANSSTWSPFPPGSYSFVFNIKVVYGGVTYTVGNQVTIDAVINTPIATISSPSTNEGGNLVYTVNLYAAPSSVSNKYPISFTGISSSEYGTPTFSNGVSMSGGNLTIPAVSSFTITVPTVRDYKYTSNKILNVSIFGITGSGTITNIDPPPTISLVSNASTNEGNTLTYLVQMTSAPSSDTTYSLSSIGTAVSGADYGALTFTNGVYQSGNSIIVPAGVTSFYVNTSTVRDYKYSMAKSLSLTLGSATGTGIINNIDAMPTVSEISSPVITEGGTLSYDVTINGTSSATSSFAYSLNGNAIYGADYNPPSFSNGVYISGNTLYAPAYVNSFSVYIPTINDTKYTGARNLSVNIGGRSGNGTINDDEPPLEVVSVSSPTAITEGEDMTFTTNIFNDTGSSATFPIAFGGSAIYGLDYSTTFTFSDGVTKSGNNVVIPTGVTSFTTTIKTTQNTTKQADKTISLTIGGKTGSGTITDDDPTPTAKTISSPSANEGNNLVYHVSMSNESDTVTTVPFSIAGTAVSGINFDSPTFSAGVSLFNGNLNIPANTPSFTITISTIQDTEWAPNKNIVLNVGGQTGTGTIVDDDIPKNPNITMTGPTPNPAILDFDVIALETNLASSGVEFCAGKQYVLFGSNYIDSAPTVGDCVTNIVETDFGPVSTAADHTGKVTLTVNPDSSSSVVNKEGSYTVHFNFGRSNGASGYLVSPLAKTIDFVVQRLDINPVNSESGCDSSTPKRCKVRMDQYTRTLSSANSGQCGNALGIKGGSSICQVNLVLPAGLSAQENGTSVEITGKLEKMGNQVITAEYGYMKNGTFKITNTETLPVTGVIPDYLNMSSNINVNEVPGVVNPATSRYEGIYNRDSLRITATLGDGNVCAGDIVSANNSLAGALDGSCAVKYSGHKTMAATNNNLSGTFNTLGDYVINQTFGMIYGEKFYPAAGQTDMPILLYGLAPELPITSSFDKSSYVYDLDTVTMSISAGADYCNNRIIPLEENVQSGIKETNGTCYISLISNGAPIAQTKDGENAKIQGTFTNGDEINIKYEIGQIFDEERVPFKSVTKAVPISVFKPQVTIGTLKPKYLTYIDQQVVIAKTSNDLYCNNNLYDANQSLPNGNVCAIKFVVSEGFNSSTDNTNNQISTKLSSQSPLMDAGIQRYDYEVGYAVNGTFLATDTGFINVSTVDPVPMIAVGAERFNYASWIDKVDIVAQTNDTLCNGKLVIDGNEVGTDFVCAVRFDEQLDFEDGEINDSSVTYSGILPGAGNYQFGYETGFIINGQFKSSDVKKYIKVSAADPTPQITITSPKTDWAVEFEDVTVNIKSTDKFCGDNVSIANNTNLTTEFKCAVRFTSLPSGLGVQPNEKNINVVVGKLLNLGANEILFETGYMVSGAFYPTSTGSLVLNGTVPTPPKLEWYPEAGEYKEGTLYVSVGENVKAAYIKATSSYKGKRFKIDVTAPGKTPQTYANAAGDALIVPVFMTTHNIYDTDMVTINSAYIGHEKLNVTEEIPVEVIGRDPLIQIDKLTTFHTEAEVVISGSLGLQDRTTKQIIYNPDILGKRIIKGSWRPHVITGQQAEWQPLTGSGQLVENKWTVNFGRLPEGMFDFRVDAPMLNEDDSVSSFTKESRTITSIVRNGKPINGVLTARDNSAPTPFLATVYFKPENVKFYNDAAPNQTEWLITKKDGSVMPAIDGNGNPFDDLGMTIYLRDSNEYTISAIVKNKWSGLTSTTNAVKLVAFDMPKIKINGKTMAFLGERVTLSANTTNAVSSTFTWEIYDSVSKTKETRTGDSIIIESPTLTTKSITLFATPVGALGDPTSIRKASHTLRFIPATLPSPRILGNTVIETGKSYTYIAKVAYPSNDPTGTQYQYKFSWILPNGNNVEGTSITYTPQPEDRKLSFKVEILDVPTTPGITSIDLKPWTYVWPAFGLKTSVYSSEVPGVVRLQVVPRALADITALRGEPLTYSFETPNGAVLQNTQGSGTQILVNEAGSYKFKGIVSDSRGNKTEILSDVITFRQADPVNISGRVQSEDKWWRAPTKLTLQYNSADLLYGETVTNLKYSLNGKIVYEGTRSMVSGVEVLTAGDHVVEIEMTTNRGRTSKTSMVVALVQPSAPSCTILPIGDGVTSLNLTAKCTLESGQITSYAWTVNGSPVAVNGNRLSLTKAELAKGIQTVTCTPTMDKGETKTFTWSK